MSEELLTPKVFASYSWKPEDNKEFVKEICDRLIKEAGIEVILDRYELNVGDDKYHFMEKMVKDATVNKVLVFSNKIYSEKADNREGGVGTESTIISKEVYSKVKQDKFIPIALEKDENGEPYFPVFMQSRIYIDFSSDELIENEYERLVRFIYNKPLDIKPELGKPPKYLLDREFTIDSTRYKVANFKKAVMEAKTNSIFLAEEYLEQFYNTVSKLRIEDDNSDNPLDEKVYNMILSTKQLRNEFLEFYETLIKLPTDSYNDLLHRHLEQWSDLIGLENTYYNEEKTKRCSQHYKFFFKELFMYMIAIALKKEKFNLVAELIHEPYYIKNSTHDREHSNFTFLYSYIEIIDSVRNKRLNSNKKSLSTGILVDRIEPQIVTFKDLQDTDRLLYYLALIYEPYSIWFPYLTMFDFGKITIMKKAESKKFFDKMKIIFGVNTVEELKEKINGIEEAKRTRFDWDYNHEDIFKGLNVSNLASI